jgi:hypothetical protein
MESQAIRDICKERSRQLGNTDATDPVNTPNDWIVFAVAYLGRAGQGVYRNQREGCDYRENLVKAAALLVAAIEAHDRQSSE